VTSPVARSRIAISDVARLSVVRENAIFDRVQPVADLMHQAGEGVTVALAGPLHEVSIHLDLRFGAPGGTLWIV
jgi:hypothetical protein